MSIIINHKIILIIPFFAFCLFFLIDFGHFKNTYLSPSQFEIYAASVGATYATTAANNNSIGTIGWTNPSNATATDNNKAQANLAKNAISNYIIVTGFGLNIPSNARVDGIIVECEKSDNIDGGTGETKDNQVSLYLNSAVASTNKAVSNAWTTTDTFVSYGNTTDTWNETGLTGADVNSSNFGVAISAVNYKVSGGGAATIAYVDAVRITVYYTLPNLTVGVTGNQVSNITVGATANYLGGAFITNSDFNTINITQMVFHDTGSVNANQNLSNLKIYYETTNNCTYNGTENLYGTATTFNASEKAIITGSLSIGTSQVCLYPVLDVGNSSTPTQTIDLGISNPSLEVTVTSGTITPSSAISISNTTNISPQIAISLTTNGIINFNILGLSTTKDTTAGGINDPEYVQVDSGPATIQIKSTNFTDGSNFWVLSSNIGTTQVKWEYSKDGSIWSIFTAPNSLFSFDTNLDTGITRPLYFRINMPSTTVSFNPYGTTITLVGISP